MCVSVCLSVCVCVVGIQCNLPSVKRPCCNLSFTFVKAARSILCMCVFVVAIQGTPPHVAVVKMSGDVPMGYFASYLVLIKTVPGDVWRYSLNVTVSTAGLSVCSVKVIQVGTVFFERVWL